MPLAGQHHDGADHRRHAGGVANRLGLNFLVAGFVIANIVNIDLLTLAILEPASDDADTGLPFGERAERARVGQQRF